MPSNSPDEDNNLPLSSSLQLPEEENLKKSQSDIRTTAGSEADNTEERVIREDVLQCLSRKEKYYRLILTSKEILLQLQGAKKTAIERYNIDDLFGCHTLRHKQNGPSFVSAYVCFYLYPRRKRVLLSKAKLREKVPLVFEILKPGNSYEENLAVATTWKEDAVRLFRRKSSKRQQRQHHAENSHVLNGEDEIITNHLLKDSLDQDITSGEKITSRLSLASDVSFAKRYLVLVNPVSGQGKGVSTFHEKVHPVLLEAGVKVELIVTEKSGHAGSVVSTSDLSSIDGILTVGGDGLLYEVVNGLRSRPDSDGVSHIPLGAIAAGSGNGLARSIASYTKEDVDYLKNPVLTTTLAAARGRVIPINLMEIEVDGKKVVGFLSVGWGLMADIDVESEVLRAIGEPRFTLWAFLRLAKLRSYKTQLTYVPCEKLARDDISSPVRHREPVTVQGDFISVYSSCQSYIGSDLLFAPGATPGDGLIHLTYVTKDAGRTAATGFLLGIDKGNHLNVNGVNYVTVQEFSIRSPGGIQGTLTIDGEKVTGEEIRIKVSQNPLYVFAL